MEECEIANLLQVSSDGVARLDRRVYTDSGLFDLEMERIWHRTWVYLAHESQLPKPRDYITTHIGRQPIIVVRDADGQLRSFINACPHRGAQLLCEAKGSVRNIVCPYHAWSFNTRGDLLAISSETMGAYPASLDKSALGLKPVPLVQSYRGFIFGCLDQNVCSLQEHLGDAATFIDLLVDQSTTGWEVLKGRSVYTYEGNWKLQAENAVDGYHAPMVHGNFSATMENRRRASEGGTKGMAMSVRHDPSAMAGGYFDFGRGHVLIWRDWDNPQDRFNYEELPQMRERMGDVRAHWAIGRLRNLLIYPNLMIMDQMSTQIRVLRPLAVDRTEVSGVAFAPVGEVPEQRRRRLRFFEDFFNPSGMATPDDLEIFNRSQQAFAGKCLQQSDISRGARHQVPGGNAYAQELDIRPLSSGAWIHDEGIYVGMYRAWIEQMQRPVA